MKFPSSLLKTLFSTWNEKKKNKYVSETKSPAGVQFQDLKKSWF